MEHERNTQGDLADVVTGANEARPRAGGTAGGHHQLQPPPAVFHGQIPSCDIPYSGLGHGPPLGAYLPASELAWAVGSGAGMAMAPHGAYVSPQQLLQISQAAAAAALPGEAAGGGEDGEEAMQISPQSHEMIKRKNLVKKVVCIPAPPPAVSGRPGGGEVIPSDLWAWRKYGQKPIKGSPYPRGYYRCSSSKGCMARKQVERSRSDPNMLVITYTAEHNHPWPMHRNVLAGYARSHTSTGKIKKKNLAANNSSATTASDHDHDHEGSSSSSSAHNVYCNNISSSFKNAVVIDGSSPDPDGESDQNAATAAGLYDPDHDELFAELEELETDASTVSLYYSKELASGGTTTTGSNDHKNSTMHPTFDMFD